MGRPEEAQEAPRRGRLLAQLAATLAAAFMGNTNAIIIGWGVVANWQLQQPGSLQLDTAQRALLMAVVYLGCAFGCLAGGKVNARFGPRGTMLISLLPIVLSNGIISLSSSFQMLMAGRFLSGFSSGLPYAVYTLYISCTSSPAYRGMFGVLPDIISMLLIAAMIALGTFMKWTWLAVLCGLVPTVVPGLVLALLPHDPAWLVGQGRLAEAKRAAVVFDVDIDLADSSGLDGGDGGGGDGGGGVRETLRLLTKRKNLAPLVIMMTIIIGNAFSGYMAILTYSLEFFRRAGFELDASVCSILFVAIRVVAVLVTSQVVDRAGRRTLLLVSCGGVSVCYFLLVLCYQAPVLVPALVVPAWLPLAVLLAAGFVYSTGFACVPWCLVGELFPKSMRPVGGSVIPASYSLFSMVATYVFPVMLEALGASGLFLFYAAVTAAIMAFVMVMLPETKGLSLAAIETLFDRPVPPSHTARVLTVV
ncbi:facilitated trehalose transporter Tret1-like [Pollicipes pollicipes]|uniref:facilitated trehalose transporter Tret1-like n=1 Tax=Pollicipes pollicipes TaxID=41117 RepID=UPI0018857274|nr:facilitated trehalose transporter Tret1-like [Pollicipes pollicipes]